MALSAALRTGEQFGAGHLIDVVTGATTEKVTQWGHATLPTFGVGKAWSKGQWQAIFRQMLGRDLVRPDPARYGALRMTEAARPVLKGEARVLLRADSLKVAKTTPRVRMLVAEEDEGLLAALKAKRRVLAEAARVPAYVIFADRTLIEMAEKRPATLDDLAGISGVGAVKLERYGRAFLEVLLGEPAAEEHPARRKLAGTGGGALYDRLMAAQADLRCGADGTAKPMSCPSPVIARVAQAAPTSLDQLSRLLGERQVERFGERFLEILRAG
jgi:ATP-dependent DNA helicase RecQ